MALPTRSVEVEVLRRDFHQLRNGNPRRILEDHLTEDLSREAAVSLEWINGESEPSAAPCGCAIAAGAVNCGQTPIALCAQEEWSDSFLAKLLAAAPVSATRDGELEKFIARYMASVLGLAAAGSSPGGAGAEACPWRGRSSFPYLWSPVPAPPEFQSPSAAISPRRLSVGMGSTFVAPTSGGGWNGSAKSSSTKPAPSPKEAISLRNPEALARLTPSERGANDSLAFDATSCAGAPAGECGLLEQKADFYFLGRDL